MPHDDDDYSTLRALTDEERRARGAQLAGLIRALMILERDHAQIRKEQHEERQSLRVQIRILANSLWRDA